MKSLQNPGVVLIVCNLGLFAFSGSAALRLANFSENCSGDFQHMVLGWNIASKACVNPGNKLEQNVSIGGGSVLLPVYLC